MTPKKAPKKASKKRSCRHRDDEQEEADEEAGALEAIGSDAASEEEPTKSEDEDDGMGGCDGTMVPSTPSSRAASRALVAGGKIPRPQSLPMLEGDEHFEPRALAPMRTETWAAGVEVAWVPQGLAALLEAHGEALRSDDDVVARLDEALPVPGSALLARPADGTANAAIVEGVTNIGGGVTLLTLRSTSTLGATADGEDDDDGEEGAAGRLVLPVIDRLHCNVDQYVVKLPLYRASLARVRPSMHVAVPFAEDEGAANLSRPKEVLWEGRVFDPEYVADPEYPTSKYKCLHVAWYRQLKQTPTANQLGDGWVFDDEQTDNFQSPWDTLPSAMHGTWRSFNPKLAKQLQLRPRRGVIKPNALEAVPESMEARAPRSHAPTSLRHPPLPPPVASPELATPRAAPCTQVDANAEDERELITSVLKRLLSNEATQFFYYPVTPPPHTSRGPRASLTRHSRCRGPRRHPTSAAVIPSPSSPRASTVIAPRHNRRIAPQPPLLATASSPAPQPCLSPSFHRCLRRRRSTISRSTSRLACCTSRSACSATSTRASPSSVARSTR